MARPGDLNKVGNIYFIQSERQNAVKIGFADNVYTRHKSLQTGNPHDLTILRSVRGTYEAELVLHRLLRRYRLRLEWYEDKAGIHYLADALQDELLDRAIIWLAETDPHGHDVEALEAAIGRQFLTADDVRQIVREEGDWLDDDPDPPLFLAQDVGAI